MSWVRDRHTAQLLNEVDVHEQPGWDDWRKDDDDD